MFFFEKIVRGWESKKMVFSSGAQAPSAQRGVQWA